MCATFCPTGAIAKFDDADGTLGVDPHSGRLREVRQLPGRVPRRCHHTARRRARKLAYRRQPPPLRHDAPSCEPYRQPPPDPRHLPSRLQRRHLRAVGEPQPIAEGPPRGEAANRAATSDFSAKQERPHLPTAPTSAPAATRPRSAPAPGAPILFTAPGVFYAKGKRKVKVVPSCAVLVTAMVPLWAWAMSRAMASPSP